MTKEWPTEIPQSKSVLTLENCEAALQSLVRWQEVAQDAITESKGQFNVKYQTRNIGSFETREKAEAMLRHAIFFWNLP